MVPVCIGPARPISRALLGKQWAAPPRPGAPATHLPVAFSLFLAGGSGSSSNPGKHKYLRRQPLDHQRPFLSSHTTISLSRSSPASSVSLRPASSSPPPLAPFQPASLALFVRHAPLTRLLETACSLLGGKSHRRRRSQRLRASGKLC